MLGFHLATPEAALIVAMQSELERRGFLEQPLASHGMFCLSQKGVRWVLDGDKLFRAHRCATVDASAPAADRPWWSLPLVTQHLSLAAGQMNCPQAPRLFDWQRVGADGEELELQRHFSVAGREFALGETYIRQFAQLAAPFKLDDARGEKEGGAKSDHCIELDCKSIEFFELLIGFLAAARSDRSIAKFARYRCVLLDPLRDGEGLYSEQNTKVQFVPAGEDTRAARMSCYVIHEGSHGFVAFEAVFSQLVACSEVLVVNAGIPDPTSTSGDRVERVPPLRIDAFYGDEWRTIKCHAMPALEEKSSRWRGTVRCFLPKAVPLQGFVVPDAWVSDAVKAELFAEEVRSFGLQDLDMARSRLVAARWLAEHTGSKSGQGALLLGDPPALRQWPGKDKQQLWAALWLVLHFVPGRLYREAEVDWMIATRFVPAHVPDCPTIRKELERRSLMERQPGGSGFQVASAGLRAALAGVHVVKGRM